jgi:hypothetical protein
MKTAEHDNDADYSTLPPATSRREAEPRPVHELRFRNIRAAIWHNEGDRGLWYSVTISRSYRDTDGNWQTTDSFNSVELLVVSELAREAFHWIAGSQTPAGGNGGGEPGF